MCTTAVLLQYMPFDGHVPGGFDFTPSLLYIYTAIRLAKGSKFYTRLGGEVRHCLSLQKMLWLIISYLK